MTPEELHHRVWPLAEPALRGDEVAAATAYRVLRGTGRTGSEPAEITAAAQQGRVETLFLSTDAPEWRTSVDAGPLIRLGVTPHQVEELDLAAVATLRQPARCTPCLHPACPTPNR
jgi:hypothetical protein